MNDPHQSSQTLSAESGAGAIGTIMNRVSAAKLGTPAPNSAQLQQILEAGARAPDHGKLAPWRFVVLADAGRKILADAMANALKSKMPAASEQDLARERAKTDRAPLIIVVAARTVDKGDSVPRVEQVLASAAAAQNMFLAANSLGFGVMWKTGGAAYDPAVKQALGLEPSDDVVAFLYVGTSLLQGKPRPASVEGRVTFLGSV